MDRLLESEDLQFAQGNFKIRLFNAAEQVKAGMEKQLKREDGKKTVCEGLVRVKI